MQPIHLEKQPDVELLNAETHAALDAADAQFERGEGVSLEQAQINIRKRYAEWQKAQKKVAA